MTETYENGYANERSERDSKISGQQTHWDALIQYAAHSMWCLN